MVHTDAMVNTLTLPRRIQYVLPANNARLGCLTLITALAFEYRHFASTLKSLWAYRCYAVHTDAMVHTYNVTATGHTHGATLLM